MQTKYDNVVYKGISRVSGFVGRKPADARWLIGVADEGETSWWWLESIEAIFELNRFYQEQESWVIDKETNKIHHVAIHLATSPLEPIPTK